MTGQTRRGVTRAYVWTLIFACVVVSMALMSAAWGIVALTSDAVPIQTKVPVFIGPLLAVASLGMQAWLLGHMAIHLLKGARRVPLHYVSLPGFCGYLIWCLGGMLCGLKVGETWTSPYALLVIPVMFVTSFYCWAVLWRQVYTTRETPMWPWDRAEERRLEQENLELLYRLSPKEWLDFPDEEKL